MLGASALGLWLVLRTAEVEPAFARSSGFAPTRIEARNPSGERVQLAVLPDARGRLREPVRLAELPPHLVEAVLHVEDRRFFEHGPVDARRVLGALVSNLRAGRIVEGGSTLTQQLARSLYLTRERTLVRKLLEVVSAWRLERAHSKREILEAYLNEIYWLPNGAHPIHGVERASRTLFGVPAAEIDLAQSALLAGMIRAPSAADPRRHPEVARSRRDFVLRQLHDAGLIDEAALAEALAAPLLPGSQARTHASPLPARTSDFVRLLQRRMAQELGAERAARGGHTLTATLDFSMQETAEESVRAGLEVVRERFPELASEPPLEAALVVLSHDASLLALVGGRPSGRSEFDRATRARRQPGSAFKPLVVLAALSHPERFSLATLLDDAPLTVEVDEQVWTPRNHDGAFRGPVTLREAVEQSLNVPIARLGLALGLERVVAMARRLGIESRLEPFPSLSLGSFETTPLELAQAYAVLAAGGTRTPLRLIAAVDGEPLPRREPERVVAETSAYLVTLALQGALDRGSAVAARELGYRGALAGKTGTTDDYRDAWFVGYTPELVLAVWVGFDDGRSLGRAAADLAVPVAAQFLQRVLGPTGGGHFRPPAGVVRARIHVQKPRYCLPVVDFFVAGHVPADECSR